MGNDDSIPSFLSPKSDDDFYIDPGGWRVMTEKFHRKRGYCCGNGCRHCPYFPPHTRGNQDLKE